MDDIMTVGELIEELHRQPPDARVMIAVVKYPAEFALKRNGNGEISWLDHSDTECIPLERGEITNQNGMVVLAVELMDYDAQRHFAGG